MQCVENRRWTVDRVTYATLDIQGSCNNLCDTAPDPAEEAGRNAADIAWMQQTFDEAKARDSVAVMFISQADPGWDLTDGTRAPVRDPKTLAETDGQPDGFQSFLTRAARRRSSPSGSRSPTSTATRTTSGSTSRS